MNNPALAMVFAVPLLGLTGCSPTAAPTATGKGQSVVQVDDVEKKRWEAEGWSYVETVGVPVDGAESRPNLMSENARSVTAVAFDGVERVKKVFPQTSHVYLLANMGVGEKNYVLVFRRAKPAQADAALNDASETPVQKSGVDEGGGE